MGDTAYGHRGSNCSRRIYGNYLMGDTAYGLRGSNCARRIYGNYLMGDTANGLRIFESSAATSMTTPNFAWQKVSLGETVSGCSPHSLNIHQWKAMSSSHLATTQLICFPPIIIHWSRQEILQTALNSFTLPSYQFILNILFPGLSDYITHYALFQGNAVAQWLRCCATSRKVAGSIPDGVIGIFHWHKILPIALWPWGRLSL